MNGLDQSCLVLHHIFRISSNQIDILYTRCFDPLRVLSSISLVILHDEIYKKLSLSYQITAEYLASDPALVGNFSVVAVPQHFKSLVIFSQQMLYRSSNYI